MMTAFNQAVNVTTTLTPALARKTLKPVAVAATVTPAIARLTAKAIAVTVTGTIALVSSLTKSVAVAVGVSIAPALVRKIAKLIGVEFNTDGTP